MSEYWIDLWSCIVVAGIGLAGGLWLGTSVARRIVGRARRQQQRLRGTIRQLHEIAATMSNDVTSHAGRMERINEELEVTAGASPEVVVASVARLLEANRELHSQLCDAQSKIEQQRTLIAVHASQAYSDPLTGLANRRAFDQEVSRRCAEASRYGIPVSLLAFDIDRFKAINDTYGHAAGDEVLIRLAEVLRRNAREADLPVRMGGEEFSVVLPATSAENAQFLAERIRKALEGEYVQVGEHRIAFTASIGIAQYLLSEDAPAWIRRADAALYAAKRGGRNRSYLHDGTTAMPVVPEGTVPSPSAKPAPAAKASVCAKAPPACGGVSLRGRTEFCRILARSFDQREHGGEAPAVLLVRIDCSRPSSLSGDVSASEGLYQGVAELMQNTLGDRVVVGMYDPGTMAVMLLGLGLQGAVGVAHWLRQAASNATLARQGGLPRMGVSVGIAQSLNEEDITGILRRAEEAVQTAGLRGGNRCFLHDGNRVAEIRVPNGELSLEDAGIPDGPLSVAL